MCVRVCVCVCVCARARARVRVGCQERMSEIEREKERERETFYPLRLYMPRVRSYERFNFFKWATQRGAQRLL